MTENNMMNVPQLRFKEFSGDWVKSKLGDISSYTKGFAFKSEHYKESGTRIIRVSDLSESSIRNNNEKIFIDTSTESDFKKYVIREGDIIITTVGSKPELIESAVGRAIYIKEPVGLLNQNLLKVECLEYINSYFIFSQIGTNRYLTHIKNIQRGNANQSNITVNDLFEYLIHTPTLPEQTKIANFLTTIDERINQLTRKKELMTQYKQGVMQQIFSQQLRFKDDNGEDFADWEEKKLGKIASFFSGGTPLTTRKDFYNGDIPFIKSGEIGSDSTEQLITQLGLDNSSAKMVIRGDILYALYGATSGEIAISKIDGAINQAVLCIRSNILNNYYLYVFLRFKKEQILNKYIQGGQGNLSAEIIKNLLIPTPPIAEQTKIANFLTALDEKIQQISQQIDATKQYKQGLLQQMFV